MRQAAYRCTLAGVFGATREVTFTGALGEDGQQRYEHKAHTGALGACSLTIGLVLRFNQP